MMSITHNRADYGPRALVIQMGARRGYAVPAAFARLGVLEALYTDLVGSRGLGKMAAKLSRLPLPATIRQPLKRLGDRKPPSEVAARTHSFDRPALAYELKMIAAKSPAEKVEARKQFNREWSNAMVKRGFGDATHVYAMMSGQTLEGDGFLEQAKAAGLTIVVDVTIALSTERIIAREYAGNAGWGAPPVTHLGALGYGNPAYRRTVELADRLVCASSFVAEDLLENWGASPNQVVVEPYSFHPSWLKLQPRPVEGRVLFAGSADLRKGIHHFASAANILRGRGHDFDFRAVGNVDAEVSANPQARLIDFRGRLTRAAMAAEYEQADVVVLPSLAEGSAGVNYEAMASGIPVVTTHESGSVLRDGKDGILVPAGNPAAIADAIAKIVTDRAERKRMAISARNYVTGLSWDNYAERLRRSVFAEL